MKTKLIFDQSDIVKAMKLWLKVFDKGEYISHKFVCRYGRNEEIKVYHDTYLEVEISK
jgi:hypothetical protein